MGEFVCESVISGETTRYPSAFEGPLVVLQSPWASKEFQQTATAHDEALSAEMPGPSCARRFRQAFESSAEIPNVVQGPGLMSGRTDIRHQSSSNSMDIFWREQDSLVAGVRASIETAL